jgi:ATP-dependent Zn protease
MNHKAGALAATTLVASLFCVLALAPAAVASSRAPKESLATFEAQLRGHQVKTLSLHTRVHSFHVTLKDGKKVVVSFPTAAQERLMKAAKGMGVRVKVAKVQPVHHKRRYIVGGVVIALILLGVAAWLFLRRQRRMREEERGPRVSALT